jgi:predicted porin
MKKSLLAVAVLSIFASAAHAQTNVTIYGVADVGINFTNNSDSEKLWKLQSGQQSGSRIGFRGTEDLGGGLSAIFTLENGFAIDTGALGNATPRTRTGGSTTRLFGRQAWVGLNGGFGSVKLGRQYSTTYLSLLAVDPFEINAAGNMQRTFGYGIGLADPISRSDNTLTYTSPNFGGVTATLGYGFGESAASFSANRTWFTGLSFVNGPINLQASYQRANDIPLAYGTTAGTAAGTFAPGALATDLNRLGTTGLITAGVIAPPDIETGLLGGTYNFGVAKAHLAVGETRVEAAAETKLRNYMVGISAPVGTGSAYASWNRLEFRDAAGSPEADQYAVGYSHPLSKRTNLYTSFGFTDNDAGVRLNTASNGATGRELQVGIRHKF